MDWMLITVVVISLGLMLGHEFRKRFVSYRDTCQQRLEIIYELRSRLADANKDVSRANILSESTISKLTKELEHRSAQVTSLQEANRKAALTIEDLETEIDAKDEKIKSMLELPEKWQVARRPLSEELAEGRVATLSPTERVLQYEATQIPRDPNKAPAFEFADWEGMVSGV